MQRAFQRNGAPRGYGQQQGSSIYLDQPQPRSPESEDAQQQEPYQRALAGGADRLRSAFGRDPGSVLRPQVQDRYGRSPSHPDYNRPPDGAAGYKQPEAPEAPAASTRADRAKLAYGGGPGVLEGFRTDGYEGDEKAANSVKNTFGRIAQRYAATPSGLKQLMEDEDFKRFFPNAKRIEHPTGDKIDFGGVLSDFESGVPVGVVDVGRGFDGANDTGGAWWWGHDQGGAPAGAQGVPMMAQGGAPQAGADQNSILAALMQNVQMPQRTNLDELLAQLAQQTTPLR
jgi:hypothetical protein